MQKLWGGGVIQNGVLIGEIDDSHRAPIIEEGAFIGAKAIILGPVVVGKNSKIGAGSVCCRMFLMVVQAVGNPARILYK